MQLHLHNLHAAFRVELTCDFLVAALFLLLRPKIRCVFRYILPMMYAFDCKLCVYASFRIFWFKVDGLPGGVSGGSVSGLEERLQHMEDLLARFGVGPIRVSKIILRTV